MWRGNEKSRVASIQKSKVVGSSSVNNHHSDDDNDDDDGDDMARAISLGRASAGDTDSAVCTDKVGSKRMGRKGEEAEEGSKDIRESVRVQRSAPALWSAHDPETNGLEEVKVIEWQFPLRTWRDDRN